MKTKHTAILSLALSGALLLGLTGCGAAPASAAPASAPADAREEITVTASGSVMLVPDKASVSFGVSTRENSAEAAQSKNSEDVQKVMDVLTAHGVEEKSIRTVNYNLYPQYDYSEMGEQRIVGYVVYTTLNVQDQDIDALGTLLSACVAAGVNNVDSVIFTCSGYDEAYREALGQAVAASKDKAQALADAAGRKLGEAVAIVEGWQDVSARYDRGVNTSLKAEAAMDAAGPVLQPGETEIRANVTVTYSMK